MLPMVATPRIESPWRRMMSTNCALQILAARSATARSTGCTSVGEAEITCRISLVAVWRSSASCVSLNSRAFWIAITAWSAKVLSSARSRPPKGPIFALSIAIDPMPLPSHISGANSAAKL